MGCLLHSTLIVNAQLHPAILHKEKNVYETFRENVTGEKIFSPVEKNVYENKNRWAQNLSQKPN